ncbi:MAG: ATP synthase subunit I [Cyanobacteria bacterium P01_A01_bin.123]
MTFSENQIEFDGTETFEETSPADASDRQAVLSSMEDYYRLQQNLLRFTLILSAVIFGFVWVFYSLHVALNYLIGACTGVVYLRMLAKGVAELGRQRQRLGSGRLALFIGLMVVATQWQQLEIVPVFLGFLTYKASLIGYTIWTSIPTE